MGGLKATGLFFDRGGDFSLGPLDITVPQRGLCSVIGPNGGGKSTLLKLLAGVLRPARGTVLLEGRFLSDLSRRDTAARIGYLPQEVGALYDFSVEAMVAMGMFALDGGRRHRPSGCGPATCAMEKTRVIHLKNRSFSSLSGGEKQRVLLASVWSRDPAYLLLDEPTSGLDPHHGVTVFRMLQEATRHHCGALVVSHDINLAAAFSDSMIFMDQGRILAEGLPDEVLDSEAVREAYGGSMGVWPHPDGKKGRVLLPERGSLSA
ncbi:ABC transporter ATP-binding protein [Desulfobotulus sp. H1]|uniref:ABC transporter ATP-binding protein n=1 Tax=Desulfobotulus pelophilus TaxID=2823377 RepID=A0ABT3N9M3_9BACT|nr:ABC transporter ATP-binding protein [Desulfobotulus pelophilus]MCW7754140.1 ABC transporter ATP-binding protein [Desulfobotulus pelophilus]